MEKKSPILIYVRRILQDAIDRIDKEEDSCSEEMVTYYLDKLNAESKGYFKKEDFVNYDEAMRILHIGNRVTLKNYLDKNGVKTHKINNMRVGFLRSEIEALSNSIEKVQGKRQKHNL